MYILKTQVKKRPPWPFLAFLALCAIEGIKIAKTQAWEGEQERKEQNHLGKFFDSLPNLSHVRRSEHPREENGNCYLVRHETSLK